VVVQGSSEGDSGIDPAQLEAAFAARVAPILARAAALEGQTQLEVDGQTWRADCSGFVAACYGDEGDLVDADLATPSIAETMWLTLERRAAIVHEPRPGDLVFFDDTYDRNGNGRRDDPLSHVGLVEAVGADGTVTFLHFGSGRVKRDVLNLDAPAEYRSPQGAAWNSFIRRGKSGERLAGQLFRGFARPLD
jgi:peptidoglycan DL-endopeptidase CwlO